LSQGRFQINKLTIKGNWNEVAGKVKQKLANLTNDDSLYKEGKVEEFLGTLQKRFGTPGGETRKPLAKL
jgi:uncharacterized protein YjbJ (UPF0337 family)